MSFQIRMFTIVYVCEYAYRHTFTHHSKYIAGIYLHHSIHLPSHLFSKYLLSVSYITQWWSRMFIHYLPKQWSLNVWDVLKCPYDFEFIEKSFDRVESISKYPSSSLCQNQGPVNIHWDSSYSG